MADYARIYDTQTADYHALINAEDARGAVSAWFKSLDLPTGADVLDVGAGTGRLAGIVAALDPTASLTCTDGAAAMLDELKTRWLGATPTTVVADYRALPFEDQSFNIVMAGWALGHLTGFYPETWRAEAALALGELFRVARPGAMIVIFETLGTGTPAAAPPKPALGELYAVFHTMGFSQDVLRTDYLFATRAEAERLTGFFFGDRVLGALETLDSGVGLIEWTGAWHARKPYAQEDRK